MKKKKNVANNIFKGFMGISGLNALVYTSSKAVELSSRAKHTEENENIHGYNGINLYYNFDVQKDNFAVIHINPNYFDWSYYRAQIEKCISNDISITLVLDTNADNLCEIYRDVDVLQAFVAKYDIDMSIYCNIDKIMQNKSLNIVQRQSIIKAFLDKTSSSDMYIGLYGTDSNLVECSQYILTGKNDVPDIHDYDCFVVQDDIDIRYDGSHIITQNRDDVITASLDLAEVVKENNLNQAQSLVLSDEIVIKDGDTYHSLSLQYGLSEDDLYKYNGYKELKVGDSLKIPNLYKTFSPGNNRVTYNHAVARGIDISDYNNNIDWEKVSSEQDYVIVEVSRNRSDYNENEGSFVTACIDHISGALNNNMNLGLYFLVAKDMSAKHYGKDLDGYLTKLDNLLSEKGITLSKENIPVFLDFEVYHEGNDYYAIMDTFDRVCKAHGYSKIGIYGNKSTLVNISKSLKCADGTNLTLKNTDWYVWQSGGPQYSAKEYTSSDNITLDEVKEIPAPSNSEYVASMAQVTNVCVETGAGDGNDHCDVSFLYDEDLFDNTDDNEYVGTIDINLDNYPNVPVTQALMSANMYLSLAFTVALVSVVGKTAIFKLFKKNKVKKKVK